MAVNINTVYNTVLAIANKEQRGYIAPSEFNLYAQQVQREIFEAYFYDDAHFSLNRKGMAATGTSDIKKNIQEKIDIFSRTSNLTFSDNTYALPSDLYRLGAVYYTSTNGVQQVPMIPHDQLHYTLSSPLTQPTATFPKFTRSGNNITVYPITLETGVSAHYVKTPDVPRWAYFSPGSATEVSRAYPELAGITTPNNALYNAAGSTNFELHSSEQYLIIEKILVYAGIQLRQPDLTQALAQDEAADNANKKQ